MNDFRILRVFLRLFWFGLAAALVVWITLQNVPPGGKLRARADAGQASPFIGIPAPVERVRIVRDDGTPYYEITQEPVYFPMAAPRFFRTARVRVEYQNPVQPVVELGARTSKDEWQFDLRPLEAPMLDKLGWTSRQEGEYRIYEKKPTSKSVGELMNFGDPKRVAVYGFEPIRGEGGPIFHHVTWESRIVESGFDTVVAKLLPVESLDGGWKAATAEFDFGPLYVSHSEVQMLISLPALGKNSPLFDKEGAGGVAPFRIRSVSVEYQRPPWSFASFLDYAKRLF